LTTDGTGSSNLNLQKMFDFSPEGIRGNSKFGKRKNERMHCMKGKCTVDTSTPEVKSIMQKENNNKKASS
jgi:hypothetical protein